MSLSSKVTPLVSHGSRVGPVFSTKDQFVFVKVSNGDKKRAVLNTASMSLVDYADKHEYPEGALCADQSLFVPIFCKECYGTTEAEYAEALASIVLCGSDKFLVGTCCVFGAEQGEVYPESRRDFALANDVSYSGACHPQPGVAVFLHKVKKDIGRVKCYWHVHSRSVDKTFLYCCIACDDNEYTKGVLKPDMSLGFSLGTVGDNESGPVTEECSLVSVPMRPGCFCTLVTGEDVKQTMTRMGFSSLKDSVLDAGLDLNEVSHPQRTEAHKSDESSDGPHGITETVRSLRKAVVDQAAELRALKDVLEAIKVQNVVLTQRLKCPSDSDTLFTVQGAKDFTRRTGVKTKLCAGVKPADKEHTEAATRDTVADKPKQMEEAAALVPPQTSLDEIIKLFQAQRPTRQQPQQQPQQWDAQLQTLKSMMQLAPILQQFTQTQDPWNPRQQIRQGFLADQALYSYNNSNDNNNNNNNNNNNSSNNMRGRVSSSGDEPYNALTEEQRRKIALEYNRQESERQAACQREEEKLLHSIKASVRDALLEQHQEHSSGSVSLPHNPSNTLHRLARDVPYKRVNKQAKKDENPGEISKLLTELRALTKLMKRDGGDVSEESGEPSMMDMDEAGEPDVVPAQEPSVMMNKQQAGYAAPLDIGSASKERPLNDFISAVVTKI